MGIVQPLHKHEVRSEQCRDRGRVVPLDWQAAARRRPIEGERCDDRGPSRFERLSQMHNVCAALLSCAEEMEDSAIVPDIDGSRPPVSGHIGFNPVDPDRSRSETRARACQRDWRDVQDSDARESALEKVIDETGIPASNIDDSGIRADTGALQQPQRRGRSALIPADFVAAFSRVHALPVRLGFHRSLPRLRRPQMEHIPAKRPLARSASSSIRRSPARQSIARFSEWSKRVTCGQDLTLVPNREVALVCFGQLHDIGPVQQLPSQCVVAFNRF